MSGGWFAMNRAMFDHPIFAGKPDRVGIWAWMIARAAYRDTRQDANGKTIDVKRGQILTSYRQMSRGTGAGVQVCRTLIDKLKGENAVKLNLTHGRLLITICNYEKYQQPNTPTNTGLTQDQHTKETSKQDYTLETKVSNDADASQTIEVSVTSSAVWNAGKPFLASRGVQNPGSMIGRWLKNHSPLEILSAIEAAQKSGSEDPIPYITETLKGGSNVKSSKQSDRINAFISGARGAS